MSRSNSPSRVRMARLHRFETGLVGTLRYVVHCGLHRRSTAAYWRLAMACGGAAVSSRVRACAPILSGLHCCVGSDANVSIGCSLVSSNVEGDSGIFERVGRPAVGRLMLSAAPCGTAVSAKRMSAAGRVGRACNLPFPICLHEISVEHMPK